MARNEQLIRQLKLLQLLEVARYGRKLEELRDDLVEDLGLSQLSERTVRRDLESLQAAGFDVDTHESPRGAVWKIGPTLQGIPKLEASLTELLALSMVRGLLVPLTGTPFWQGLETLWKKLEESLPEPVWKHFDRQKEHLQVLGIPAKNYVEQQGILATLNRAIDQHRVVEIEYQSRDDVEPRARPVEPYTLAYYNGSLYLVAAVPGAPADEAIRHYKLDRFKKATALDERFKPREDFDPGDHFHDSLGVYKAGQAVEFRIRLADRVVLWVTENPWHPRQTVERNAQGEPILTIPSAYEEELLPRVLSLGDAAEVLSPESARQKLQQISQALAGRYTTP